MNVDLIIFGDVNQAFDAGVIAGTKELAIRTVSETVSLAPVAPVFGGTLRDSYTWKTYKEQGNLPLAVTPGKFEAYAGTSINYAPYVELGTRYMKPQPHLRPGARLAAGGNAQEILAKIQREEASGPLKDGVKRERF